MPDDEREQGASPTQNVTFSSVLLAMRKGRVHDELSKLLREGVLAVQEHGGVATIGLTVKVKRLKNGAIELYDDVRSRVPQPDRESSLFFPAEDGSLHRTIPGQHELFDRGMRPVAAGE